MFVTVKHGCAPLSIQRGARSLRPRSLTFRRAIATKYTNNGQEDLESSRFYDYDSGRWLWNERQQLARRSFKFDVERLKETAAESVGASKYHVEGIHKVAEQGSSRVFEISLISGQKLIAKLPYPFKSPQKLATDSEVATMNFARAHGVPVPEVHEYSTLDYDDVKSEYIIMDKAKGTRLDFRWDSMSNQERKKIISQLIEMEGSLLKADLPASGSLFQGSDMEAHIETLGVVAPEQGDDFVIGPDMDLRNWKRERRSVFFERGPHTSAADALLAPAIRETEWIKRYGKPRPAVHTLRRKYNDVLNVSPHEHMRLLSDYMKIVKHLIPSETNLTRPVLRHPNLRLEHVFVSDDNTITAIIDWRHASILPLFLQATPPVNIQVEHYEVMSSSRPPRLSSWYDEDDDELTDEEREAEREALRRKEAHFNYVIETAKRNPDFYQAMTQENIKLIQNLYQRASNPWAGSSTSLKLELIDASNGWPYLPPNTHHTEIKSCPISYNKFEIELCDFDEEAESAADSQLEDYRKKLGVNDQGWIPADQFEEAKRCNEIMKEHALKNAETGIEREHIIHDWPFDSNGASSTWD